MNLRIHVFFLVALVSSCLPDRKVRMAEGGRTSRIPPEWDGRKDWPSYFYLKGAGNEDAYLAVFPAADTPDSEDWNIAVSVPSSVKRVSTCMTIHEKKVEPGDCLLKARNEYFQNTKGGMKELALFKRTGSRNFFVNDPSTTFKISENQTQVFFLYNENGTLLPARTGKFLKR
ncbi:MAG: hypothetical protein KA436_11005 [Oligoflexales bacterium]|nr:hypothetical protein [Oligoflexales bacterium]